MVQPQTSEPDEKEDALGNNIKESLVSNILKVVPHCDLHTPFSLHMRCYVMPWPVHVRTLREPHSVWTGPGMRSAVQHFDFLGGRCELNRYC